MVSGEICISGHIFKSSQSFLLNYLTFSRWQRDVMTNQEAVEMVEEAINADKSGSAFQVAAEWLTQEAYVRGSLDNIGVCVVAII
jgi:hypothetical protein